MQYQPAISWLKSPPSSISLPAVVFEAVAMIGIATLLAWLV